MRPAAWIASAVAAAVVTLSIYAAWPAGAAHVRAIDGKQESLHFSRTGTFTSLPMHRCMKFTVTGTFDYTFSASSRASYWTHQKLVNTGFAMTVRKLSRGRCTAPAKLTSVQLGQYWTGYPCQFNPAMSPNQPWRLVTTLWPGCGNRQEASYVGPQETRSSSTFADIDFGTKVRFADVSEPGSPASAPCYAMLVAGDIYVAASSDSFNAQPRGASKKVCLSKT